LNEAIAFIGIKKLYGSGNHSLGSFREQLKPPAKAPEGGVASCRVV
jgi:hypothetical protein